jgi:hypothetical protein
MTSLGYWSGGPPAYGLRRLLLDENNKPKMVLNNGQRKTLKTERVILTPGPKREVETVRRIFTLFANKKKSRTEIADELNNDGILNARGSPWSMLTIGNMLKNEVYLGHLIYNRRSMKLGEPQVTNPADVWIRRDNAFKAIVSSALFAKARERMLELENRHKESDQQILNQLAALKRKKGHLSLEIMRASDDVPNPSVFTRRFGSLKAAYEKVGFKLPARYCYTETAARIEAVVSAVVDDIIAALGSTSINTSFLQELSLLTIVDSLTMVIAVARCVSDGRTKARRWEIRKIKYKRADLLLLVRMSDDNTRIRDYFLLPMSDIPLSKDGKRLRITDRVFGQSRLNSIADVLKALKARLRVSSGAVGKLPLDGVQKVRFIERAAKTGLASPTRELLPTGGRIKARSRRKNGRAQR